MDPKKELEILKAKEKEKYNDDYGDGRLKVFLTFMIFVGLIVLGAVLANRARPEPAGLARQVTVNTRPTLATPTLAPTVTPAELVLVTEPEVAPTTVPASPYPTYTPLPTYTAVPATSTPYPTYTPFPTYTAVPPTQVPTPTEAPAVVELIPPTAPAEPLIPVGLWPYLGALVVLGIGTLVVILYVNRPSPVVVNQNNAPGPVHTGSDPAAVTARPVWLKPRPGHSMMLDPTYTAPAPLGPGTEPVPAASVQPVEPVQPLEGETIIEPADDGRILQVKTPIPADRPPTELEAELMRRRYARLQSKTAVLKELYGSKGGKTWGYLDAALSRPSRYPESVRIIASPSAAIL